MAHHILDANRALRIRAQRRMDKRTSTARSQRAMSCIPPSLFRWHLFCMRLHYVGRATTTKGERTHRASAPNWVRSLLSESVRNRTRNTHTRNAAASDIRSRCAVFCVGSPRACLFGYTHEICCCPPPLCYGTSTTKFGHILRTRRMHAHTGCNSICLECACARA